MHWSIRTKTNNNMWTPFSALNLKAESMILITHHTFTLWVIPSRSQDVTSLTQWFLNLVAHWKHLEDLKNGWCLGLAPKCCDLTGKEWGHLDQQDYKNFSSLEWLLQSIVLNSEYKNHLIIFQKLPMPRSTSSFWFHWPVEPGHWHVLKLTRWL